MRDGEAGESVAFGGEAGVVGEVGSRIERESYAAAWKKTMSSELAEEGRQPRLS